MEFTWLEMWARWGILPGDGLSSLEKGEKTGRGATKQCRRRWGIATDPCAGPAVIIDAVLPEPADDRGFAGDSGKLAQLQRPRFAMLLTSWMAALVQDVGRETSASRSSKPKFSGSAGSRKRKPGRQPAGGSVPRAVTDGCQSLALRNSVFLSNKWGPLS